MARCRSKRPSCYSSSMARCSRRYLRACARRQYLLRGSAADTFCSTAAQIVQGTRVDTNTTNRPKAMLFEGPPGE